jgi:trehalose-phosphatase
LEHLLSVWPEIAKQLREARHILMLFDYDGTLTPIVERPEIAKLSENIRLLLRELSRDSRITLGIISGRALVDIKERVGINNIIYAGNHGLEIEGPGISFVNPIAEELKPILNIIRLILNNTFEAFKGVFVEDKGLSISVHYRQADERHSEEVQKIVKKLVGGAEAAGKAKMTSGKKVYEVRPAVAWDKGKAIKYLMKKFGKGGRQSRLYPMYFGDDLTDEDGFRVINAYGMGIPVYVGEKNQESIARYYLKSPAEVADFMNTLLEEAKKGFI